MLPVALPKQSLNQFKPVQQIIQQVLTADCPIVYTMADWSFLCISVTQQGSGRPYRSRFLFQEGSYALFLFNEKKIYSYSISRFFIHIASRIIDLFENIKDENSFSYG